MKAYRVTVLITDHDQLGAEGIKEVLENTKYPNWCIDPQVLGMEEADIGEWTDEHPLNLSGSDFNALFEQYKGGA